MLWDRLVGNSSDLISDALVPKLEFERTVPFMTSCWGIVSFLVEGRRLLLGCAIPQGTRLSAYRLLLLVVKMWSRAGIGHGRLETLLREKL